MSGYQCINACFRLADMYTHLGLYWVTLHTEGHGQKSMKTTGVNSWGRYKVCNETIVRLKCKVQIRKLGKISIGRFVPLSFMPTWTEVSKYWEQITTWDIFFLSLRMYETWQYNFFQVIMVTSWKLYTRSLGGWRLENCLKSTLTFVYLMANVYKIKMKKYILIFE